MEIFPKVGESLIEFLPPSLVCFAPKIELVDWNSAKNHHFSQQAEKIGKFCPKFFFQFCVLEGTMVVYI